MIKQKVQRMISLFVMILLAGYLMEPHSASLKSQPDAEYWPTQNRQRTTPETQGMDSSILAQLFETIKKNDNRLHSLLIARNGYLVTEAYWPPYGPNDVHTTESITKSIIRTLIGIAMNQGILQGVDSKPVDFFPNQTIQNMDEQKKSIT